MIQVGISEQETLLSVHTKIYNMYAQKAYVHA